MSGRFISLEGIDGTGKSTQLRLLVEWLRQQGHTVTPCIDPGGTVVGDMLRNIVLGRQYQISAATEAFLFMASRAELVAQIIKPALDAGQIVVSDRFLLSTVAYQGHGGGLDPAALWAAGEIATGGIMPDLSIILDLPVDQAIARRGRGPDRMEARTHGYHEKVRAGFLFEAARRREEIRVVDASKSIDDIQSAIRNLVTSDLEKR